MLDAWFRDVCYYYRDMPAPARELIRTFLNFDMHNTKDIFVHDQLAWGIIEGQKVDAPILIVRKSSIIQLHDSAKDLPALGESSSANSTRINLKDGMQLTLPLSQHSGKTTKSTVSTTGSSNNNNAAAADSTKKNLYHVHVKQNHIGKKASSVA